MNRTNFKLIDVNHFIQFGLEWFKFSGGMVVIHNGFKFEIDFTKDGFTNNGRSWGENTKENKLFIANEIIYLVNHKNIFQIK